jgi:hypothetical protein
MCTSDVYFGTDSTPDATEFQGNQTATSFDPGTMTANTTYYWRIDEINTVATTTGTVWSFTTVSPDAFLQDSGTDGIVSMEAENYDENTSQGGHSWTSVTSPSGYIGTAAMQATDNDGNYVNTGYSTNSPQLDFEVNFVKTGTHYVWVHGYGATAADNSCHAGLDGQEISTCDRITINYGSYQWKKTTMDGPDATFSVASTGVHTVNIWMREDGFIIDKIVLTTNSSYTPTGDGPDESERGAGGNPPGKASEPGPTNSATDVSINADLSWTTGADATSHDVYFGTDSTPDSGEFQGNQTATTYDPNTLSYSTTYYWRIDEVNAGDTTTGDVWSFTTAAIPAPGAATSPSPSNSATDIAITADLSWTAGSGTASHHVYFGTFSPGAFKANQTATTFNPGIMENDTTYYWRIDEVNAGGTTTGTVWSFTTIVAAPGQATNPGPSNGATDVSIGADLSWTEGTGSTSSDVYFGTDSTPDSGELQGNQTATTYDPGTLSNSTTYYWRIDEINVAATTTGNLWSFTTEVAAAGKASNPNPADSAADVSVDATLSWTAGSGSTSSNVYFGTDSTPDSGEYKGNQTAATFDPGTLATGTTYYWRIDEINASGTTTGTVWSFTTLTGEVEIIGSWTQGTTHAEQAGSNRALIFIAHCDSYATVPDLGSVTYGGQSMTLVVERVYNISSPYTHNVYVCAFILDEDGIDAALSLRLGILHLRKHRPIQVCSSKTWIRLLSSELPAQMDLRPPRLRLRPFPLMMVIWL